MNGNVNCVGPRACYDESKRMGETLCWIYGTHHNMPVTVARPFNNYGPGMRIKDARQTFVGLWINKIIQNHTFEVWGGKQMRDFNYVEDTCRGFIAILENDKIWIKSR